MKDIDEAVEYVVRKTVVLILEADTLYKVTPNGNGVKVSDKARQIALAKADLLCFLLVDAFGWGEASTGFGCAAIIREAMYGPTDTNDVKSALIWHPTDKMVQAVQPLEVVERLVRAEAQRVIREGVKS